MKTPDEIKKGLECSDCKTCPYGDDCMTYDECQMAISSDALAYIQQLERGIKIIAESNASAYKKRDSLEERIIQLQAKCCQLERERDALVDIIKYESPFYNPIPLPCRCCKNNDGDYTKDKCRFCGMTEAYGNFEWCGVEEE